MIADTHHRDICEPRPDDGPGFLKLRNLLVELRKDAESRRATDRPMLTLIKGGRA